MIGCIVGYETLVYMCRGAMGDSRGNAGVKACQSNHMPVSDDEHGTSEGVKEEDEQQHHLQHQQQPQKKNAVLHKVMEAWCQAKAAYIAQCVLMQALGTPCLTLLHLLTDTYAFGWCMQGALNCNPVDRFFLLQNRNT